MNGRLTVALGGLIASLALAAGPAAAGDSGASDTSQAEKQKMRLSVTAEQFRLNGGRVVAEGPAALRTQGGETAYRTTKPVRLELRKPKGKKCTVLDLHLEQLFVALLGLEVRTSEINLMITGDDKKALGKLFCRLSRGIDLGKQKMAARAIDSLNSRLEKRPLRLIRVNATLHAQEYPSQATRRAPNDGGPRCQILDIDVGPLKLDLLGLIVDLYGETKKAAVHIDADADPNGGAVGETLCSLSGGPSPSPSYRE
jgi:hypothetical protein